MLGYLEIKMKVYINAIKCEKCGNTIYSRANHDFTYCPCRAIYVDAGNQSISKEDSNKICGVGRVGGNPKEYTFCEISLGEFKTVKEASQILYNDWNTHSNKYGLVLLNGDVK